MFGFFVAEELALGGWKVVAEEGLEVGQGGAVLVEVAMGGVGVVHEGGVHDFHRRGIAAVFVEQLLDGGGRVDTFAGAGVSVQNRGKDERLVVAGHIDCGVARGRTARGEKNGFEILLAHIWSDEDYIRQRTTRWGGGGVLVGLDEGRANNFATEAVGEDVEIVRPILAQESVSAFAAAGTCSRQRA